MFIFFRALIATQRGQFAKADQLANQSASAASNDPKLAPLAFNVLAGVDQVQGRYRDAEAILRRSLEYSENSPGTKRADLITNLIELGDARSHLGQATETQQYYERAIAIVDKEWGAASVFAAIYRHRFSAAEVELHQEAERLRRSVSSLGTASQLPTGHFRRESCQANCIRLSGPAGTLMPTVAHSVFWLQVL